MGVAFKSKDLGLKGCLPGFGEGLFDQVEEVLGVVDESGGEGVQAVRDEEGEDPFALEDDSGSPGLRAGREGGRRYHRDRDQRVGEN